jgi:two-component system, OmpR family, KDP operon response regulator KdpE
MNSSPGQNATVLVVEDDAAVRRHLVECLQKDGYQVLEAATGQDGLIHATRNVPDAVLLDLSLPDMEGMAVLTRLREHGTVPILIVSECADESSKINALDGGAHDYITKPYSAGELMARLRAARRHAQPQKNRIIRCGPLCVDFTRRTVMVSERVVKLTPTEYSLLQLLATHAGKVLTYRQMLRNVWGPGQLDKIRCLRVYLRSLREKLEFDPSNPALLITEPGVGIRLAI